MIGLAFILVFTLLFKENGTKMLQINSIQKFTTLVHLPLFIYCITIDRYSDYNRWNSFSEKETVNRALQWLFGEFHSCSISNYHYVI